MMFLYSLLLSLPCHALAPSQNELKMLLEARSVSDFDQREAKAAHNSKIRDACQAELKARALPRSCFLMIRSSAESDERRRFTRLCSENAKKSQSRLDLSGDLQMLPDDCRAAALNRLEDLRYADEESHPELSAIRTGGPELE